MSDAPANIKKPLSMSTSVRGKAIRKKNQSMPRINLDAANSVAGTPTNTTCTTDSMSSASSSDSRRSHTLTSLPHYMAELPPPEVPEPQAKRRRMSTDSPQFDSARQACLLVAQSYALGYLSAEKRCFDREVAILTKFRDYLLHSPDPSLPESGPSTAGSSNGATRASSRSAAKPKSLAVPECPPETVLESLVSDFADKIFSTMSQVQSPAMPREDVALLLELVSEAQVPVPSASLGNFFRSVYDQFGASESESYSLSSNKAAPSISRKPSVSDKVSYERNYMAASDAPAMPICDGLNGGEDSELDSDEDEDEDEDEEDSEDDSGEDEDDSDENENDSDEEQDEDDEDDDEDEDIVNTDFDFFDLKTEDFLAIKNLLRSTLESDHLAFDLSRLTDFVIENSTGITVKSEGSEGDPLGLISIVDLTPEADSEIPKKLQRWLIERTEESSPGFSRELRKACSSKSNEKVALIFHERLLNLPFDLLPYFYQLALAELEGKGLKYDKFVVLSRVYSLEPTGSDERPAKKSKKAVTYDYFHAEDPELHDLALAHCVFNYKHEAVDPGSRGTKESEGLFPRGHALLFSQKGIAKVSPLLTQWVDAINREYAQS